MKKLAVLLSIIYCYGGGLPAFAADCGQKGCGWDSAVAYCKKKNGRLPTIDELLQAWEAKCTGGKTSDLCSGWYWSSMERNSGQAWGVSFREGAADSYKKNRIAPVYCGPQRKSGEQAAPAAANAGAPGDRGGTGAKCADGRCNWYEAVAYCRSSGTRLYKVKEWYELCPVECKKGAVSDNCKRWYWLSESENENYAHSGKCESSVDASVHSTEKTSPAYARCAR